MKNIIIKISLMAIIVLCLMPIMAMAQPAPYVDPGLKLTAEAAGLPTSGSPITIVSRLVNVVLGFLGVVFIVLIIYAGSQWMTSAGNEEKISSAKKMIGNAIIGLAIVMAAYAITYFIFSSVKKSTLSAPPTNSNLYAE